MIDKATYSKFRYEWYRIQKTKVPVMFDNLNEFVQWCKDSGYLWQRSGETGEKTAWKKAHGRPQAKDF